MQIRDEMPKPFQSTAWDHNESPWVSSAPAGSQPWVAGSETATGRSFFLSYHKFQVRDPVISHKHIDKSASHVSLSSQMCMSSQNDGDVYINLFYTIYVPTSNCQVNPGLHIHIYTHIEPLHIVARCCTYTHVKGTEHDFLSLGIWSQP